MEMERNQLQEIYDDDSTTNDKEALKSQIPAVVLRCAKAALLLSSLKSSSTTPILTNATIDDQKERERLLKAVADLKVELVKERHKNKKNRTKLCSAVEFALQIMVVLSFASFCCIIFLVSGGHRY